MIVSMLKLKRADFKHIKDAYSVHKIVYSLFPKKKDSGRDFLYVDKGSDRECRKIFILSERSPKSAGVGELFSHPIPDSFLNFDRYRFEVLLNPVKKEGKTGKLIPVKEVAELNEWFVNKVKAYGFDVDKRTLEIHINNVQSFEKNYSGENLRVTHNSALFKGVLEVKERDVFAESFKHGIGKGKAFGFGLLQIVPLKDLE